MGCVGESNPSRKLVVSGVGDVMDDSSSSGWMDEEEDEERRKRQIQDYPALVP